MRRVVLALAVALAAACSGSPKPGGDGGGAAADMTVSGPPDLAPRGTAGIACGAIACTTTQQLCCTADNGRTGDCQAVQNPACGSSEFLCDGPEDCEPANPECCVQGGLAACRPAGFCAMQTNARFMCHTTADCINFVTGALCHDAGNGSPYALCF